MQDKRPYELPGAFVAGSPLPRETGKPPLRYYVLPGMRIWKTVLAVLLCLIIDYLRVAENPYNAAISAIVCMQMDMKNTWVSSLNRSLGTALAGLYAYAFLWIFIVQLGWKEINLGFVIVASLGVLPLMQFFAWIRKPGAMVIAAIVFILIVTTAGEHDPLVYTFHRVIDTLIGVLITCLVNWFPPLNHLGLRYEAFRTQGLVQLPEGHQVPQELVAEPSLLSKAMSAVGIVSSESEEAVSLEAVEAVSSLVAGMPLPPEGAVPSRPEGLQSSGEIQTPSNRD